MVKLFTYLIRTLNAFSSDWAATLVHHLLSNPQVRYLGAKEVTILDLAESWTTSFESFQIQGYRWGPTQGKLVVLVHGWEGHTGNLGAVAMTLVKSGYQVLGFDAPAHGRSSSGRTDMFQFARFITIMLEEHKPHLVISNSFGTTSAMLALRALKHFPLQHWIMIASPYTFLSRMETVRKLYHVPKSAMRKLHTHIEDTTGEDIHQLNFQHYKQYLNSVRSLSIIHAEHDSVVASDYARDIHDACEGSKLYIMKGSGHYGILWSDELLTLLKKMLSPSALD